MRVWAVADSDSYLKWSAATLAQFPMDWETELVLLRSPVLPSPDQVRAATGRPVRPRSLARLLVDLVRDRPDVLLLGCTGPAVAALTSLPPVRDGRIVLVGGLPGQSLPASARAVSSRAACDVMIVHSRRERVAFAELAAELAPGMTVGLARLPFLSSGRGPAEAGGATTAGRVVFAAQALVPADPEQRRAVLRSLVALEPPGTAVVKIRAAAGEQQTHHEAHPYQALWDELVGRGEVTPGAVRFTGGSMDDALAGARAVVTVSSTAALEAMSRSLPVAVLTDFGVSDALLNAVFADSGCLATLADVEAGRIATANPEWLADNGLHPEAESDWRELVAERCARRARGPRRRPRIGRRALARTFLRLVVPTTVVPVGRRLARGLSDPDPR